MKIALASMGDPMLVTTWSGTPTHIALKLESLGHTIIPIQLRRAKEPWYYNWLRRIYYRIQKKWFLSSVEERVLKSIGKLFDEQVEKCNPDVVIVFHGDFLSHTTFKQPACIIHDTTFAALVDYYPSFTNLTTRSVIAGNRMYSKALNRAAAAVFSASWASNSAITYYHAPAKKINTIPFGANLKDIPKNNEVDQWIHARMGAGCCQFLFLGIDWERKGGPDALCFVRTLNNMGVCARLVIVGCEPAIEPENKPFVEQVGFLHKNVSVEAMRLEQLLIRSQALLLPTQAECYGCVFCEANAYGLPVIGRDTGGVSEIIKDGVNGLLLTKGESIESLASRWLDCWNDSSKYLSLSFNARREFEHRLNYDVFTVKLEKILYSIIKLPE